MTAAVLSELAALSLIWGRPGRPGATETRQKSQARRPRRVCRIPVAHTWILQQALVPDAQPTTTDRRRRACIQLWGMCVQDIVGRLQQDDPPTLWVMAGNPQTLWVMTVSLGGLPKYHRSLGGNGVLLGKDHHISKVKC